MWHKLWTSVWFTQWLYATGAASFTLIVAGIWWPKLIGYDLLSLRAILVAYAFGGVWAFLYAGWRRWRRR
jgi:hypothetical protein